MRAFDAFLGAIYASNRWYDGLDEHHGVWRFLLCLIPIMGSEIMIVWDDAPLINITGVIALGALSVWRVIPIFVPLRLRNRRDGGRS